MTVEEARQAIARARPVAEIMDPRVYQRAMLTSNFEEADRVPIWDYIDSWPLYQELAGDETDPVRATARVFNTLGIDFCRSIVMPRPPEAEGEEVSGDHYGQKTSGRTVWVTKYPINSQDDLAQYVGCLGPVPALDDLLPEIAGLVPIRDLFAPETFYIPGVGVGFHAAYGTMGLGLFSLMLYDARREVHALIEHLNAASLVRCQALAQAQLSPFVFIGDDIAYKGRLMFSPRVLTELFFPYLRRLCEVLREAGIQVIFHSDGDVTSIIPDLLACGINGLNPLETMAGMDIGFVKREYGRDLILVGGVDCSQIIPRGTPETIRAEVGRVLHEGARGGGMFIGSSSEIVPATPLENIYAFYEACRELGRYPLM